MGGFRRPPSVHQRPPLDRGGADDLNSGRLIGASAAINANWQPQTNLRVKSIFGIRVRA